MDTGSLKLCKGLLLALFMLWVGFAVAQQTDYSKIKVDNLNNQQIEQLIKRAEAQGLKGNDLYNALQQRGMSAGEINKLKQRAAKLEGQSNTASHVGRMIVSTDESRQWAGTDELFTEGLLDTIPESKIFGADLFRNGHITFEPNLNMPTPANYIIGAGDQLNLDITGDNEVSYQLPVSSEGTIKVEYAGIIPVAGLTVEAAKSKIAARLSSIYPAMRSGRTRLDINLGNIRSISVTLTGFVTQAGTYTLPSMATVFNALYAAGGPSDQGSYRTIQVIRNNQVVGTIDTYDFLVNGIQSGNIRLEDQDVIHIPVYGTRVEFEGLVKRPGIFEAKEGETFNDILRYAGGFESNAYTARVKVLKTTDRDRSIQDIYQSDFETYIPHRGDQYIVEEVLDRFANRVQLEGAVFRPGYYQLSDGLTVKQLLQKADGIKEDAFMTRAYINRLNPDNTQRLISFDLQKLLDGQEDDIVLRREDRVIVSSIFDLRDEYNITIDGEVRKPGQFKYADDMTLGNAIHMAGGLAEAANIERIEIARRVRTNTNIRDTVLSELMVVHFDNKEEALESDFVLQPFDIISIRTSTGYQYQRQVRIEGEVQYPGVYTLVSKDEKISDLIQRAGGFTDYAYLEGASLQRVAKSSEIAVQNSKTGATSDGENDDLVDSLEMQNVEARNTLLSKIKQGNAQTDLYFNKYIGIELGRIIKNPRSKFNILLEEGDILTVPRQLQTVKVVGEVLSPISVVYQKGRNLEYYVNQAGGYTSKAHKSKTFVQYANGSVKGTQKGLGRIYPEVKPGSEIVVPQKPEKDRMSAQSVVGLTSGVVSMLAIIVSLLRN